jgi:peptidoglycan hydrolase CwlO-like protein
MKKERVIAAGSVITLIVSLIITGLFYNSNKFLANNLDQERLKTELMLSEKLALQKEIHSFKNQIKSITRKNEEHDKILGMVCQKLGMKEAEINRIVRKNGNVNVQESNQ